MYHFIGIKGSGMSSLATILCDLGYKVQGSDIPKHFFTEEGLIKRGINIFEYSKENIKEGLTIICGASIKSDNVELVRAKELGLEIIQYNEMVGKLTRKFKTICVCGCHGKTTTTTMLASLNKELKMNYLIGDGTGYAFKGNDFFALESCEYQRHFLEYSPYYTIITNVDLDHVDYYKDINDVMDAYSEFANKTEKLIIACGDDKNTKNLKLTKDVVYYGFNEDNDIKAINLEFTSEGTKFDVIIKDKFYEHFELPLYGKHQVLDALSVIAVSYYENVNVEKVKERLTNFSGAKRRFSITEINNSVVIDDYAHHPNEVRALINAVKQKYSNKQIIVIFQPHTFSRTKAFANDFVNILKDVDYSYVLNIFPSREKQEDYPGITSKIITSKLSNSSIIDINDAKKLIKHHNAVFVFMSPNDISKLENDLKEELRNEE